MNFVATDFVCAGGNRHPSAADVDVSSGYIAFGAGCNVALWRPSTNPPFGGIETMLSGHTESVNAVRFLNLSSCKETLLLSGAADNTIRIWRRKSDNSHSRFACCNILEAPHLEASVNVISCLNEDDLFASAEAQSEVKVWKCVSYNGSIKVNLLQQIIPKPRMFPLAISMHRVPSTTAKIIAIAGSHSSVLVLVSQADGASFEFVATLTGHEGWVRGLDFAQEGEHGDLLLASASHDKYIRLWRFRRSQTKQVPIQEDETLNTSLLVAVGVKSLSNKAYRFSANGIEHSITFEALLLGHEEPVYNIRWERSRSSGLRLLSASGDSSLSIWEPEHASGLWTSRVRLGEISPQKGATTATGSAGGFWIGLWHSYGNMVLSLGRTGSWRVWNCNDIAEGSEWMPGVGVSGHTKPVNDLAWASDGSYLLSTSSDQTTRLFALMNMERGGTWHELSRPQIHGYDLNCVDTLGSSRFVSGADEKLLRVFEKPKASAHILSELCEVTEPSISELPDSAQLPVLGLSNKSLGEGNGASEEDRVDESLDQQSLHQSDLHDLLNSNTPPVEDYLAKLLLWPEIEKLYGHGNNISASATSHDTMLLATACNASSTDQCVIRIYETEEWREFCPPLIAHNLTVTKLAFSPDDKYLLSVGRDRQCFVFYRRQTDFSVVAKIPKAHTRMVLSASWGPIKGIAERRSFATAGRDGKIHLWVLHEGNASITSTINAAAPVTTVAHLPRAVEDHMYLAYGLADGSVFTCKVSFSDNCIVDGSVQSIASVALPSKTVTQLVWRPAPPMRLEREGKATETQQLAVSSEDFSVRIFNFEIPLSK